MGAVKRDGESSSPLELVLRHLVPRAALLGWALGVACLTGASLVLGQQAAMRDLAVLLATALLGFAVGLWAGSGEAREEILPLRDRWLAAAALMAVAGAFSTFSLIYRQLYPNFYWSVAGLVLGVGVPAYAIGLVPPVLLAWAGRVEAMNEDDSEAGLLVPGSLALGFLGGVVLALLIVGLLLLPSWSTGTLLMLTALILLLPLIASAPEEGFANERVIFETVTPYATVRVTEVAFPGERQPERRLYLNDEEESGELVRSGAPTLAYIAAAEHWLAGSTPPGADYLFLGGGAYTLPRRIAERDRQARIAVVELDPEVTRVAYRFFGLNSHHAIRSIHGDARAFLEAGTEERYDRIFLDVYGGGEALPQALVTVEAASRMGAILRPGGRVSINLIGSVLGPETRRLWSVVETYAAVFPSVAVYTHLGRDYPDRQNLLLAAAPEAGAQFPPRAGMFEIWPRSEWPATEGTIIFRDLQPGSRMPEIPTKPPTPGRPRTQAADR